MGTESYKVLNSDFEKFFSDNNTLHEDDLDKLDQIKSTAQSIDYTVNANNFFISYITGNTVFCKATTFEGFVVDEQNITIPSYGTWYVGYDLYSKKLMTLPRNIHRGWLCFAKLTAIDAYSISSVDLIKPIIPKNRLENFVNKVMDNQIITAGILGSSLAESTSTSAWTGMLFDTASDPYKYRIPVGTTYSNIAVGGSPNKYILACTGLISNNKLGTAVNGQGISSLHYQTDGRNGRSKWFNKDILVLTCLANGGNYRIEALEPIFRNLKKMGREVIITCDNPQNPVMDYNTLINSTLYTDGPAVAALCEKYGFEFADTAAYVFDGYMRGYNPYADTIHQTSALPNGPTVLAPSCGHELYARAIRSCVPITAVYVNNTLTFDFASGLQGFTSYSSANVSVTNNQLVITKNTDSTQQWGAWVDIPAVVNGNTLNITVDFVSYTGVTPNVSFGLQGGGAGWGSSVYTVSSTGSGITLTVTANRDILSGGKLLIYPNNTSALTGANVVIDNLTVVVNTTASPVKKLSYPVQFEYKSLPDFKVKNNKMIGDCIVILPPDEAKQQGTLSSSNIGSRSFGSLLASSVLTTNNTLTLATGQEAAIAGNGINSLAMIYCNATGDTPITLEVYASGVLKATLTYSSFYTRETFSELLSQDTIAKSTVDPDNVTYTIKVTAGTLKLSALIAFTSENEYITGDEILKYGTWSTTRVNGGSSALGYWTNTLNDYAGIKLDKPGRVYFITSNKPSSKNVDIINGEQIITGVNMTGVSHIYTKGGIVGDGMHYIKCKEASSLDANTGGYALHLNGAIIVRDR